MSSYKLSGPLNVPMILLIPTMTESYGVETKTFPTLAKGIPINGTFRTFGGSERSVNGVYSVENTATVETWYRPDIKADCRVALADTGAVYEIVGTPEDIGMRHQYMVLRLTEVKGGA